ncbi:MAG TPA: C4-dicarboxylate ABC transporter substrate-binding protein, partial [Pelagibacteraceae bacterium]|nr:C4-dicarboxylate ABC transporter substrate-binding protein [Pelagibacteraceae bacterium]
MKKFISAISGALMMFALSAPLATVAKSEAVFFSIGTGGPTGV